MGTTDLLYVCVDSGGTKTIACVIDGQGFALGMGYGGPANSIFVSETDARYAIREAVLRALGQDLTDITPVDEVKAVYLSAPGLLPAQAEAALRPICPRATIVVEGDAYSAYRGALPFDDGIVALAGTGSFACGTWQGRWETIGGWGPLLGDEGSGYWIGVEALKAVALAADGRGPKTQLSDIFKRTLHYSFDDELRRLVYSDVLNRQRIAGLTLLVTQAARQGDNVASDILKRAGEELAKMVRDLAKRMGLDDTTIAVSATGGVVRDESLVLKAFRESIAEFLPLAQYKPRCLEPWMGAALRTLESSGIKITQAVTERLLSSSRRFTEMPVS